ncbi:MAG: hypothetical protein AAFU60_01045, partial [Bacteroidota bacterium]
MKSYIYRLFILLAIAGTTFSCEVLDLEVETTPNAITPEQSDISNSLNNIQLEATAVFGNVSDEGMELTRMTALTGSPIYQAAFGPTQFDAAWNNIYSDLLIDVLNLIPVAETQSAFNHTAVAKILLAYTMT